MFHFFSALSRIYQLGSQPFAGLSPSITRQIFNAGGCPGSLKLLIAASGRSSRLAESQFRDGDRPVFGVGQ